MVRQFSGSGGKHIGLAHSPYEFTHIPDIYLAFIICPANYFAIPPAHFEARPWSFVLRLWPHKKEKALVIIFPPLQIIKP